MIFCSHIFPAKIAPNLLASLRLLSWLTLKKTQRKVFCPAKNPENRAKNALKEFLDFSQKLEEKVVDFM